MKVRQQPFRRQQSSKRQKAHYSSVITVLTCIGSLSPDALELMTDVSSWWIHHHTIWVELSRNDSGMSVVCVCKRRICIHVEARRRHVFNPTHIYTLTQAQTNTLNSHPVIKTNGAQLSPCADVKQAANAKCFWFEGVIYLNFGITDMNMSEMKWLNDIFCVALILAKLIQWASSRERVCAQGTGLCSRDVPILMTFIWNLTTFNS